MIGDTGNALIAIEITDEQATAFRLFMEHYDQIKFISDSGVWNIRQGTATLHFNKNGEIDSIERRLYSYAPKITPHNLH